MNSVIADLDKNVLYLVDQLNGVKIEMKTEDGKFLKLNDFLQKATSHMQKENESITGNKVPSGVVATLLGLKFIPAAGVYLSQPVLKTFASGFQLGVLFERMRTKRNVAVTAEEFELNASEMDAVINGVEGGDDGTEE